MKNFIISTDSCVDLYKSSLIKQGVYSITMKRVLGGKELGEHFDSAKEFDGFYETLKKGAMPTTVALNPEEMSEHFQEILKKESTGDIIHIPLSSGLSVTCENSLKAAAEINKTLKGRQIFVVDSLIATIGMAWLVEELLALRDKGATTKEAISRIEQLRDHMQGWVIMNDLFHLRRGGRISGFKATIGTLLNIKPIIIVNDKGKLAIESKVKGSVKAIQYLLSRMEEFGEKANKDFTTGTIYIARTSENKIFDDLKAAIKAKYPNLIIREGIVGPIIGTHLGCGGSIVLFEGAKRLTVN